MQKGLLTRLIVHQILKYLKDNRASFEKIFDYNNIYHKGLILSDKNLIRNIVLTAMRNEIIIKRIINKYTRKIKINGDEYFILLSAIAQIIFLNFKEYAVIHTAVQMTKNKKIKVYPAFINGVLRNILREKNKLIKIKPKFANLPNWFVNIASDWNDKQKNDFINTIREHPDIHLVFKKNKNIVKNDGVRILTTKNSLIIKKQVDIVKFPGYKNGDWWIQDFSSMLPLFLINNFKNKSVVDMCSAPGGKSFQLLDYGASLISYEKNKLRANIFIKNLKRLNYNTQIVIKDSLTISNKKKFDIVIVDAPSTSIGTIRRNPEIFFRKHPPDFNKITLLQTKLLEKAKALVKNKGIIVYMVCSFFHLEGGNQIDKFLIKNKNFKIVKFKTDDNEYKKLINKKGFFETLPINLRKQFLIDGFFAAQLKKDD